MYLRSLDNPGVQGTPQLSVLQWYWLSLVFLVPVSLVIFSTHSHPCGRTCKFHKEHQLVHSLSANSTDYCTTLHIWRQMHKWRQIWRQSYTAKALCIWMEPFKKNKMLCCFSVPGNWSSHRWFFNANMIAHTYLIYPNLNAQGNEVQS